MPRATNSVARNRRKKKVLKEARGQFGGRSKLYRTAKNSVERGWAWQIPIDDETTSIGVVTEKSVFQESRKRKEEWFYQHISTTRGDVHDVHARPRHRSELASRQSKDGTIRAVVEHLVGIDAVGRRYRDAQVVGRPIGIPVPVERGDLVRLQAARCSCAELQGGAVLPQHDVAG